MSDETRPLHIEATPARVVDLRGVPTDRRPPGPDLRLVRLGRHAPIPPTRPLLLPPPPERHRGGCRARVAGVRCLHPERSHRTGHNGWRQRCDGCGCTGYRDPWGTACAVLVCVGLMSLAFLVLLARYGALVLGVVDLL